MKFLVICAACLLGGCVGTTLLQEPVDEASKRSDTEGTPERPHRTVTVSLDAVTAAKYLPIVSQRVITAEPFKVVERSYGEVMYELDGIEVIRILDHCSVPEAVDAPARRCRNVVRREHQYLPVEKSGITNESGQAVLQLRATRYRLRLETVPTVEDEHCYWGGAVTIEGDVNEVSLPMLVHCESE